MRGRKPNIDRPQYVKVSIPTSLLARIDLMLYDPILRKPAYGARSSLIVRLLRERVDQLTAGPTTLPQKGE